MPEPLEVATFDGDAWVGALAHEVELRAGGRRVAGPFPRLNVRTYVRHGDQPGVYFLGPQTGSPAPRCAGTAPATRCGSAGRPRREAHSLELSTVSTGTGEVRTTFSVTLPMR